MSQPVSRRRFLATTVATTAAGSLLSPRATAAASKTVYRKALIGAPTEAGLSAMKAAGFDGMEASVKQIVPADAEAARRAADRLDMTIHGTLFGWANVNRAEAFDQEIAAIEEGIRATASLGATAMLLVPCRIGGMPMPKPCEFDIDFDPATGHLNRVVAGDNSPYQEYIAAHDEATDATRRAIERLVPTAEKQGVVITVENVWNNLWVKPAVFSNLIDLFDSPWAQAYFDIANHLKYAPPQQWIPVLGNRIQRCHAKDFQPDPEGPRGGTFVNLLEGGVDFPAVMSQLDRLGKDELWLTIEGSGGLSLEERSRRLDKIIARRA